MHIKDFFYSPTDINSKKTTLMVMVFAAVGYTFLLLMPSILGAFVTELGYSGETAGEIASANMFGVAIASVIGFVTLPHWNLRIVVMGALVSLIFLDLGTAFVIDAEYMIWIRFTAGLCTGLVAVTLVSVVSGTLKPERIFALLVLAQFTFSAVAFQFLPMLFDGYGVSELFLILALATALSLPLVRYASVYPAVENDDNGVVNRSTISLLTPMALLGLASTLALYFAYGGIWAFAELIGLKASNVSDSDVSTALSFAMIASIFAASLAAILDLKLGRMIPLTVGTCIVGTSIFMFNSELSGTSFILYTTAFNAGLSFVVAYYMGFFAWLDPTGRLNAITNFIIFLGLGLGPFIGGGLITQDGSFNVVINTMVLSCVIAVVLMWMVFVIIALKKRLRLKQGAL